MSDEDGEKFKNVVCKHATAKAILVVINGKEHWIPQSQVHDDSEVWKKGDSGTLVVKARWAEKLT